MTDPVAARNCAPGVAVVIPARNEAATIGEIVGAIAADRSGLVAELVVVDSYSTDGTASRAAAAGARVVALDEVLPTVEPRPGKGEAMWRGVGATTSDIVVFVDGDLVDFDARIIAALAQPLIANAGLSLIKAAYDRPASDLRRPETGGGRVTELMARPLIGAFWPQLDGVLQPLGGEYAARRRLLERLPFRCGYGVELGLLIDTLHLTGADSIGQVDLGDRVHRNADLAALGRMSAEILHTAMDRLASEGRMPHLHRWSTISQPVRTADGLMHETHEIDTAERPPLVTIEGYSVAGVPGSRSESGDDGDQLATM